MYDTLFYDLKGNIFSFGLKYGWNKKWKIAYKCIYLG